MKAIELGRVFADAEVASLYRYRAPYPREVFATLELLFVEPRVLPILAHHGVDGIRSDVIGYVAWGRPV